MNRIGVQGNTSGGRKIDFAQRAFLTLKKTSMWERTENRLVPITSELFNKTDFFSLQIHSKINLMKHRRKHVHLTFARDNLITFMQTNSVLNHVIVD